MLIESIIQRDGGTIVEIHDARYHFKPGDDGCHVAEVADANHAELLLSIREGYRPVRIEDSPAQIEADRIAADAKAKAEVAKVEADRLAAEAAAREAAELAEADAKAKAEASEIEAARVAAEAAARKAEELAAAGAKADADAASAVVATEDMSRDQLAALFETKFGEKPHHKLGVKTLVERING